MISGVPADKAFRGRIIPDLFTAGPEVKDPAEWGRASPEEASAQALKMVGAAQGPPRDGGGGGGEDALLDYKQLGDLDQGG